MNRIKLAVLSLLALAFARPAGCCTANAESAAPADSSPLALLCKGAGVKAEDVTWRIQAGLSLAQAVEVALNNKNEAAATKGGK